MNPKKENKLSDATNCHTLSFLRNSYLEIRNPIPNFKIHGQKTGKWAYYDKDKNPIATPNGAKFMKWVNFHEWP